MAIEHVVIICKENKTYDQYFGRFPGGDGDPNLKRGADPPKPYHLLYLLQRKLHRIVVRLRGVLFERGLQ